MEQCGGQEKEVFGSIGPATMTKNGTCDSKYKQKTN